MPNLIEDFKKYRDQFGLNQFSILPDGTVQTSQNGTLNTMEYLICLLENNVARPKDRGQEVARIKDVFASVCKEGLSYRFPGSGEIDSMDNTVALLTFSNLFGTDFATKMREHGEQVVCKGQDPSDSKPQLYKWANVLNFFRGPKNFWNNQHPELFHSRGWFGRSPAMLGLLLMASGKPVYNPIKWLGVLVGQFIGPFKPVSDQDTRKLPYVVWYFLKHRSLFWALMYKLWCYILMKQYKNGMRDVYSGYYQDPNHPIHKYSPPYHRQ